jgi:hypothetical protein
LSATIVDPKGELTTWSDGRKVIYYHLKISNRRPSIPVSKCRVILKEIQKKNPDNSLTNLKLAVPTAFQWAPADTSPVTVDFTNDQVIDFGFITQGADYFCPSISPRWNNFQGYIKRNETLRYKLEILSNNSKSKIVVIEVSWDGSWHEDLNTMSNSFKFRIL